MKKCFFSFFLFSLLTLKVSAAIDLQPNNVYERDGKLYVTIQNNGTENFVGFFSTLVACSVGSSIVDFNGCIAAGFSEDAYLIDNIHNDVYDIIIDCHNNVREVREDNNEIGYQCGAPRLGVIFPAQNILSQDYRDTLFVLPGEYFYSQFALREMNDHKVIMGIDYQAVAGAFFGYDFHFGIQMPAEDTLDGGYYSYNYLPNFASFVWMANNSAAAEDWFYLGYYYGTTCGFEVGQTANIYMSTAVALTDLSVINNTMQRTVKVIDRIRGDVNDDGLVNQNDLDQIVNAVENGLYNPCLSFNNLYVERGLNYGAGIILFSKPDFVSNCLLNIWIHDHNDPLVQGLGIGELMSAVNPCNSRVVEKVENVFSVSGNQIYLEAPGANMYNIVAVKPDGSIWQASAEFTGGPISIPNPDWKYQVETVNFSNLLPTGLSDNPADKQTIKVYPNPASDYVIINGTGSLQILNSAGQLILTSQINDSLTVDTSAWPSGLYIVKIISSNRAETARLIKK